MRKNKLPKCVKSTVFKTELNDVGYKPNYKYMLLFDDEVIFSGHDFFPSPLHEPRGGWKNQLPAKAVRDFFSLAIHHMNNDEENYQVYENFLSSVDCYCIQCWIYDNE